MQGVVEIPGDLLPLSEMLGGFLADVSRRFDGQLVSEVAPVADLVRHVERYRGKMLRPTLVLLCGLAAAPKGRPDTVEAMRGAITPDHLTAAAVCEMVHMATLVHDDVLDEAEVRRRAATVNHLHGNEPAVILGDYLFSAAYHLCSQIQNADTARIASLEIGRASMAMCRGELLQLHHRGDFALDEETYSAIVAGKTGELIATSCLLGAILSGAGGDEAHRLKQFGMKVGIAFQIQDDLLDLLGSEGQVGKSVHKDLEKGKLTLPLIHHLKHAAPGARAGSLKLMQRAAAGQTSDEAAAEISRALRGTGSIDAASDRARQLIREAKAQLAGLGRGPAVRLLETLADAVIDRTH